VRRHKVSERRACRLLELHRSTKRYRPITPVDEARVVRRMNELAEAHPRWGYRAVCQLMRKEGFAINEKRVERLWRKEGHRLPPPRMKASGLRAIGVGENSSTARPARRPHDVWTYDFMSAQVRRGGKIRILNVMDEFTRLSLGSHVARSISANAVVRHLERLFDEFGPPVAIRSDNGREFISATVKEFLAEHGVRPLFIEKASPQQVPLIERFNGTMRRDLLNVEEMENIPEAQVLVNVFNEEYNKVRPHRSLNKMTPQEFLDIYKREVS
jgi:transposase InsO family protein